VLVLLVEVTEEVEVETEDDEVPDEVDERTRTRSGQYGLL
jgi:hypothetical protein